MCTGDDFPPCYILSMLLYTYAYSRAVLPLETTFGPTHLFWTDRRRGAIQSCCMRTGAVHDVLTGLCAPEGIGALTTSAPLSIRSAGGTGVRRRTGGPVREHAKGPPAAATSYAAPTLFLRQQMQTMMPMTSARGGKPTRSIYRRCSGGAAPASAAAPPSPSQRSRSTRNSPGSSRSS